MTKMNFKCRNGSDRRLALALVALGVLFRLLPHPGNFTPTAAIALFSGVALEAPLAFAVPLLVMVASDVLIGPHSLFWLVWLSFVLVTWLGQSVRERDGVLPVALAALGGSVLFFVVTNLGVFLFERMYARSAAGLVECFTMALPFFRNSLAGDLFYSLALFSVFELCRRGARAVRPS